MKFKLEPTINKEFLLERNSQETYLSYYLGLPVKKGLYKNPLRADHKVTCAFYKNSRGDIIFKDFGTDFSGNFISVVMYKYNCSYYKALRIIANDFGYIDAKNLEKNPKPIEICDTIFEETKECVIQVKAQDFTKEELDWWKQFGITEKTLKKFRVFSCATIWLNGYIFTRSDKNHPIFGYYRGKNDNGTELWRIYLPNHRSKEPRFLSNWKSTMIQGSQQLPKEGGDLLVVTKSLKDVMSLYELGITAIAPNSENLFVAEAQYNKLKQKFKKIVIFYDNDLSGISNMNKFRKQFPDIIPFWIPRKYECKDVSDFVKKYGIEEIKKYYGKFNSTSH